MCEALGEPPGGGRDGVLEGLGTPQLISDIHVSDASQPPALTAAGMWLHCGNTALHAWPCLLSRSAKVSGVRGARGVGIAAFPSPSHSWDKKKKGIPAPRG